MAVVHIRVMLTVSNRKPCLHLLPSVLYPDKTCHRQWGSIDPLVLRDEMIKPGCAEARTPDC